MKREQVKVQVRNPEKAIFTFVCKKWNQ